MSTSRQRRKFHTNVRALMFAVTASLLSLLLYWIAPGPLEELDQRGQDLVFELRETQPPPPEIVVVAVDEKSIKQFGRWPWSRTLQARLIGDLKALGAGLIALDIMYLLPESAEADQALALALQEPGAPVVGGYFFRIEQSIGGDQAALDLLRAHRVKTILKPSSSRLDTVAEFPFVETNQDDLAVHFGSLGFFNALHDRDGLIRSVPLVAEFAGDYYPSLLLAAMSAYAGLPVGLRASSEGLESISLGPIRVPVDVYGRLALNFYNGERTIPAFSAADVLAGNIDPAAIRDRLVFVGVTEIGIADLRPTPIDPSFPGVMLHATAAANVIQGYYLYRDNRIIIINVVLMGLVPLLMVLVLVRIRRPVMMAVVFALIVATGSVVFYWLVAKLGFLVSFVYPTLAVAMGFTVFVTYYILTSQRKNRFLTQAFSSYVSPALVDQLLDDPDKLKLAGEKRTITVLFSDIRGFTTISEAMEPEQLSQMLNIYLDAMCEIIMDHQGTLDKYIGDAVMAMYNAPLYIQDHPICAATSSLAMLSKLDELNEQFEAEFGLRLAVGMGINTGTAVVGNLGGARRFDYTAIGDTVNVGSRLEGATKQYGVKILLTETTREQLDERFQCRKIDRIQVKGKHGALEIYELMGEVGDLEQSMLAERYEAALTDYFNGEFEAASASCRELLADFPGDQPTAVLQERCATFLQAPPPADWEGVYVATQK